MREYWGTSKHTYLDCPCALLMGFASSEKLRKPYVDAESVLSDGVRDVIVERLLC